MTFPCNSQYLWNVWINISLFISGSGGRWRGVGRGIFDMDRDKLLVIWTVQLCVLSVLLISCEQRQIQSWKCFHYLAKGKLFPDEYSNSLDPSSLSHSRQLKWIFNVVIMRYDGVFSGGNYDAVLNNIRATLEPICKLRDDRNISSCKACYLISPHPHVIANWDLSSVWVRNFNSVLLAYPIPVCPARSSIVN